jgi:hypothetical protein
MYSATLLVAAPMYLPTVTKDVPSWAERTTPMPEGPGFPRLPPSKLTMIVSFTAAFYGAAEINSKLSVAVDSRRGRVARGNYLDARAQHILPKVPIDPCIERV